MELKVSFFQKMFIFKSRHEHFFFTHIKVCGKWTKSKKEIEVELSPKTKKKSKEIPKVYNQDLNKNPKEQPDF